MNNELIKTIEGLNKSKEKNVKNIERYNQEIISLKEKNKQIDNEIKSLKALEKKYSALDEQVKRILNPDTEEENF